jgi:hypothetical protein
MMIIGLLFATQTTTATTPVSLLKQMQSAYSSLTDAYLMVEVPHDQFGDPRQFKCMVLYKRPNRVFICPENPRLRNFTVIVSNGKLIKRGRQEMSQAMPFSTAAFHKLNFDLDFETYCLWDSGKLLSTQPGGALYHMKMGVMNAFNAKGEPFYVLQVYDPRQDQTMDIWVQAQSKMISMVERYQPKGHKLISRTKCTILDSLDWDEANFDLNSQ